MDIHRQSLDLIIERHGVDLHDFTHDSYRQINRHGFFLALTATELARKIIRARERSAELVIYTQDHLGSRWAGDASDASYLEDKARTLRMLSTEIDVCLEMLRLAVQGFKGN